MNTKIKVVYHRKTRKMIPFMEDSVTGEIIITTTGSYDLDSIVVGLVDPRRLDLLNGYVLPEGEFYSGEE